MSTVLAGLAVLLGLASCLLVIERVIAKDYALASAWLILAVINLFNLIVATS